MRNTTTARRRRPDERNLNSVAAAVTVTRDLALPVQADTSGCLQLTTGVGDLRAVVVHEVRSRLLAARDVANKLLRGALREHEDAEASLKQLGYAMCGNHVMPHQEELLAALTAWRGRTYEVILTGLWRPSGFNSHERNENTKPEINIEKATICGKARVWQRSGDGDGNWIDADLDVPFELPFNDAMLAEVARLRRTKTAIETAQADLTAIDIQLSEVSQRGDALHSALTQANLRGELRDTTAILAAIDRAAAAVALPPAVETALKALPASTRE